MANKVSRSARIIIAVIGLICSVAYTYDCYLNGRYFFWGGVSGIVSFTYIGIKAIFRKDNWI